MRQQRAIPGVLQSAIGFLAVLLVASAAGAAAGEAYRRYVMDGNYFSCDVPVAWELVREKERDEDYRIYEIQLARESAVIFVSYYAADNEDFNGFADYLRRNSQNVLGETKNAREHYEPVREITLGRRKGFELARERLVYLHPQGQSEEAIRLKEKQYVLPAREGFYVLHLRAPRAVFPENARVFEIIAESFVGLPEAPSGDRK